MFIKNLSWIDGKVLLVIAPVLIFHAACHNIPPPTFDQVLRAFGEQFPEPHKQSSVKDADIYVNLSQSMRGFVAVSNANSRISPNSNYRRVLESLLDGMSVQGYSGRRCSFSLHSPTVADKAYFLDASHYTDVPVPLAQILDHLVTPSYDSKRLSIIISDMVASGTATGQADVNPSTCFRKLSGWDAKVLLLGFRSAYDGTYHAAAMACENHQFPMSANQSLPGSGRPFYLMVIAPDQESLQDLRKKVLDKLQGRVLFDPLSKPIPLEGGDAETQPNVRLVDVTSREDDCKSAQRFYSRFAVRREAKLRFVWITAKDFDDDPSNLSVKDVSKLSRDVRSLFFDKSGNHTDPKPDQLQLQVTREANGNLLFEYQVRPPDSYPWVVFQVKMAPGSGNLIVAHRTVAWSTNDDCTAAPVKRTYQLDRLGEALANPFLQDTVFAEHYIAIRRD
jgi:hypothetical protein